ncbi:DUF6526 family protein [Flavobacterium sp. TMP13]|uniref:DUF6526 family protein n=1 Tax=unclassified Flavobacterium TaxID=196869 RepID=UPI00076DC7FA|nr:DUF6526 family protein [Flavobacterium sp. TAB 87]KVV15214.1 hypothetical protein AP058_01316 [Flavobacterium sp. TAB 87]
MKKQSYSNHIRFYTPHHFIYYPIIMALIAASVYFAFTETNTLLWTFIAIVFVVLFCLAFMVRQHYALTLQNRIVKLEMRYRYFTLTNKRFENIEFRLSESQIFALRFAPDEELVALVQKAISDNLSATQIKKAITNWKGDYERV